MSEKIKEGVKDLPSFMKDELKQKDEQKLAQMKEEIKAAMGDSEEDDASEAADAAEGEVRESENPETPEVETAEEALEAKVAELEKLVAEKEERVLRLQADFENFRRRTAKERAEISEVVLQGFLIDLLPMVDNFERAMAAENSDAEAFRKGVEMINTQFGEILKKNGLEKIETEGKKFDPNFHQAVMRVENPELEDDDIAQELQKGYMVKGHVLRPSMVQVVANN